MEANGSLLGGDLMIDHNVRVVVAMLSLCSYPIFLFSVFRTVASIRPEQRKANESVSG